MKRNIRTILLFSALLFGVEANALTNKYLTAGAAKGNGSGSDWNNAANGNTYLNNIAITANRPASGTHVFMEAGTYTYSSTDSIFVGSDFLLFGSYPTTHSSSTDTTAYNYINNVTVINIINNNMFGGSYVNNITFALKGIQFKGGGHIMDFISGNSGGPFTSDFRDLTVTGFTKGAFLFQQTSVSTFTNCIFINNSSPMAGAAIALGINSQSSSLTINNCSFTNNTTTASSGFDGGAVASTSKVTISGSSFCSNSSAGGGGALGTFGSTPNLSSPIFGYTITNTVFNGNSCSAGGGGAIVVGHGMTINCTACKFYSNSSAGLSAGDFYGYSGLGGGGAVYAYDNNGGTPSEGSSFTNCQFYNNSANNSGMTGGGAICIGNGTSVWTINNCIFDGNQSVNASAGGGAIYWNNPANGTAYTAFYIQGCTFVNNKLAGNNLVNGSDIALTQGLNYSALAYTVSNSSKMQLTKATYKPFLQGTGGFNFDNTTLFTNITGSLGAPGFNCPTAFSYTLSGNVWDDANGDAIKASESFTNGGGLYVNLVSGGAVVKSALVNSTTGAYSLSSLVSGTYTIVLTNSAVATASTINSNWVHTGVNLNGTANTGNKSGIVNASVATSDITNQNFGIEQRPFGVAISYQINPVPTRGSIHALTSAYRNMLPLGYNDAEDCISVCPANFGVVITALTQMNGNQLAYNGTLITAGNLPFTISSYNPDLLTVTFNQSGLSSFTFHYQVIDAAGVQSIDPDYTAFWGGTVLAVNLLGFTAEQQGDAALLKWSTATGSANDKFTIERSADSRTWSALKAIAGTGSSGARQDYSYTDNNPLSGDNYYRIKQVDKNGNNVYSETRLLKFGEKWIVSLYPNPVTTGNTVKLVSSRPVKQVRITDLQGRIVQLNDIKQADGNYRINTAGLASGVYFVSVTSDNGAVKVVKLVKRE